MSIQSTAAERPPVTWKPTAEQQQSSRLWDFMSWVTEHRHVNLTSYRETCMVGR
jgi:acetoacetyl-CoA synthetase